MTLRLNDGTEFQIKSMTNNNNVTGLDGEIDTNSLFTATISGNGINVTEVMKNLSDKFSIPSNLSNIQLTAKSLKNVCVFNFESCDVRFSMTPTKSIIILDFKRAA